MSTLPLNIANFLFLLQYTTEQTKVFTSISCLLHLNCTRVKMPQALSNLMVSLPLWSKRSLTLPRSPSGMACNFTVKNKSNSVSAENRDNLDHLQRVSNRQPQQQQPRRRVVPVAPVGLWDRFPTARTVQQMMDTMDRLMEEPLVYPGGWASPAADEGNGYSRGRTPWEIKEGENEYKMRFDMPGMTKEDVKVWVEEKMLVVKAEKVAKKKVNGEEGGGDWSAKSYGRYSSRIALPENVQFEKITAEVRDGVLYITIPKASITAKILDINVK